MHLAKASVLWILVLILALQSPMTEAKGRPRPRKQRHFNKTAAIEEIQSSFKQELVPLKEIEISTCQ